MNLYAVNADYRPWNRGRNWYYVVAKTKKEVRQKFSSTITWLDIYEIKEVETEKAGEILNNPYKYIVLY